MVVQQLFTFLNVLCSIWPHLSKFKLQLWYWHEKKLKDFFAEGKKINQYPLSRSGNVVTELLRYNRTLLVKNKSSSALKIIFTDTQTLRLFTAEIKTEIIYVNYLKCQGENLGLRDLMFSLSPIKLVTLNYLLYVCFHFN